MHSAGKKYMVTAQADFAKAEGFLGTKNALSNTFVKTIERCCATMGRP